MWSLRRRLRCWTSSDEIVHFYGACLIPNHVMVTEFAPFGSLAGCIKKRMQQDGDVKEKVMPDVAMGLAYLHFNGILHRDIKPDNLSVFSLDDVLSVNCKLMDFGSSRNINMLLTNMSSTKGHGSLINMASEVLDMEKFNQQSDVFPLGVTITHWVWETYSFHLSLTTPARSRHFP